MSEDVGDYFNAILARAGLASQAAPPNLKTYLNEKAQSDGAMAAKVARLFSSAAGLEVLKWLDDNTLARGEIATDMLLSTPGERILHHAIFRAGENSVVEMIQLAIAQAQQKPKRKRKTV